MEDGRYALTGTRTMWARRAVRNDAAGPMAVGAAESERARAFRRLAETRLYESYKLANAILGNAVRSKVLKAAGLGHATTVLLAIPDPLNTGAIVSKVKKLAPEVRVIARGHQDVDVEYLRELGADRVLVGVYEVADIMARDVMTEGEPT